jgi:hypothetical protein
VCSGTGYSSLSVDNCRTMRITSAELTALEAQLCHPSKEVLQALLSTHPSATTIVSTPVDNTTTISIRAHATHMPLPNIPVGRSLPAITDHFSHGAYQSSITTPQFMSQRATIIHGTFAGFRTSAPPPTPMAIHHGGLHRSHQGGGGLNHLSSGFDQSPHSIEVRTPAVSLTLVARAHHGGTSHHVSNSHHGCTSHHGAISHHDGASLDGGSSHQGGHRLYHY